MATYYIRIDTYWQGSRDRFVGPFATREAAQTEIEAAVNDPRGCVTEAGHLAANVKDGIRVHEVLSKTEARRVGLRAYALGDDVDNLVGARIPRDTDELMRIQQETM